MEPIANETAALTGWVADDRASVKRRSHAAAQEPDKELEEAFTRRLCNLLDTSDFFGRCSALTAEEKIARMFLASPEDRQQSEFNCAVSPKVRLQVPLLFQAAAGVLEERSGVLMQSSAEIDGEGFGRALLYSGRIIIVLKSLRAGFPFPFTDGDRALRYAVACVEEGLAFMDKYKDMTALYGTLSLEG